MTANEKVAHRKLSMLQLAQELKSVSEACREMTTRCTCSSQWLLIPSTERGRLLLSLKLEVTIVEFGE
jgi:hypothetical protein